MTALDYRAWGALQRAGYGNGRRLALGYDQKRSQLASLQLRKTDNTDVVSNLSYDYYNGGNNNGRLQKITDADSTYTTTFGYDDFNRLTSASASAYTRSYSYDAWGNLTGVTSTGAGESGSYSLSYAANGSGAPSTNRINNTGYTFDSAGNVTNDGNLAHTYDAASRLKTAGGDSYQYDGDGHRVRNQISGYSNALYYLWSSVLNEPVVEIDSTTPSVFRAYVYGPGGQMLALQSYDGNFYWLHTDVLGSGRKMTDSSGAVIYRGEYDPHGQMVFESATGGATYLNSHKFTGYERDWSTNLDNAKARTFNHNKGRFMQPDPLSLGAADATNPQSLNLYSYVQNDPMNFVDPTGLNEEAPLIVIETREPYGLDPSVWAFFFRSWLNSLNPGGGGIGGGIDFGGGGQQKPAPEPHTPDACGDMANIAQEQANKAIRDNPGNPKAALSAFDRNFTTLYAGRPATSLFAAGRQWINHGAGWTIPEVNRGETGFRAEFRDSDPPPPGEVVDQTHHFAFYLSMGVNENGSGALWSAAQAHRVRDNRGDNNLGKLGYDMGYGLRKDPSTLKNIGNTIRNGVCDPGRNPAH